MRIASALILSFAFALLSGCGKSEETIREEKRHEEAIKNAGKAELKIAEELAKMRGVIREDAKIPRGN